MKVLVLGPGGREHAIILALAADPEVSEIFAAPGNPGIAEHALCFPQTDAVDTEAVTALAVELGVDLVVVGPEAPLAAGVADALQAARIPVFGPSQAGAALESSKAFAKEVMEAAAVPTARAVHAEDLDAARDALEEFGAPYVVKDDGLAAGKGVVVTEDQAQALAHAQACFAAGGSVVIEEFLDGPEVSLFVISDGADVVALSPAQDFKRAYDHDAGPNTGGMGAYTPLDWLDGYTETTADGSQRGFVDTVVDTVAKPTIAAMAERGTPFVGVLYCGLAVTSRGVRVIEFNARFGDPETQVVLNQLRTPLGRLLLDAATASLGPNRQLEFAPGYAAAVVLAAENYPESPRKGDVISGIDAAAALDGVSVLHAGTATADSADQGSSAEGYPVVTAGGRVLATVGTGDQLAEAVANAYRGAEAIQFDGAHYRRDIAARAVAGKIQVAPALPGWVHLSSGKVRELYTPAADSPWAGHDVLLVLASDRISAYDHALRPGIPNKGVILTQLSLWWFDQLQAEGIPHHVLSTDVPAAVAGRAVIVRKLEMVPVEAIVRGYLTGSGLAQYQQAQAINEYQLPSGLVDGSQLPEPMFTPSTKAEVGDHDENISYAELSAQIGEDVASRVRELSLRIYHLAQQRAESAGILLADTKFEFGVDAEGELVVADEVLTPDSSRFWPADQRQPGSAQPSFDKQYVRNWLRSEESGWSGKDDVAPPALPPHVIEATAQKYREAYDRLTGTSLS